MDGSVMGYSPLETNRRDVRIAPHSRFYCGGVPIIVPPLDILQGIFDAFTLLFLLIEAVQKVNIDFADVFLFGMGTLQDLSAGLSEQLTRLFWHIAKMCSS